MEMLKGRTADGKTDTATTDLAELLNHKVSPRARYARTIQEAAPRLSARNVLALVEAFVELADEDNDVLSIGAGHPVITIHPAGARVATGYVAYGNGRVNTDANGDISSIELIVDIQEVE